MGKRNQKRPTRICFECTHYEACQAWNIGTLVETDATHCVNYRDSVGKTNADRIRSMTDEELTDWLWVVESEGKIYGPRGRAAWIKWLKEEAKT